VSAKVERISGVVIEADKVDGAIAWEQIFQSPIHGAIQFDMFREWGGCTGLRVTCIPSVSVGS
jgi:hypothetical protein